MPLWFLCRAIDQSGSGKAEIDIQEAADTLGCSIATVNRNFREGLKLGIFRAKNKVAKNQYLVYFSSLERVCEIRGTDDPGFATEIPVSELRNMRFHCADAIAQQLQFGSRLRASKQHKKTLMDPQNVLPSSDHGSGARGDFFLHETGRFIFAASNFIPYGGSQAGMSKQVGWTPRTLSRRLSNATRAKRGVEAIAKRQILLEDAVAARIFQMRVPHWEAEFRKINPQKGAIAKTIKTSSESPSPDGTASRYRTMVFATHCNIYEEKCAIKSKRSRRRSIKKAIAHRFSKSTQKSENSTFFDLKESSRSEEILLAIEESPSRP